MRLFLLFVGVIANFQEMHLIDLGLAFTEKTDDFILVTENSIKINFMQPILMQCEMKDRNSPMYLNVLDQTRSMIQHSGMGPYVNNITDET